MSFWVSEFLGNGLVEPNTFGPSMNAALAAFEIRRAYGISKELPGRSVEPRSRQM